MTESVSGLNPNAPVTYRGVDVGKVREIAIDREDPARVRVLLDIEGGTPVKEDTVAILVSQGITDRYRYEMALISRLRDGLADLKAVRLYCAHNLDNHVAVLLCNK